ncbi:cysteine desulfurase [Cytobacillus spongiae]|jgi:cysteine desulfurase|uniref:cysteine desulfurase family protein n=1 Tax=Cytobacillus spongiae TaxID=2901381 RepID=UPI001F45EE49|nr:cysteine desulfurase family protein [Cytobacillus spongiae]UII55189.1 cysteine desulfurase [Cytobacillus spongiae]
MIYFDNSATTKPYTEVLDSFLKVASDYFGNPSSLHEIGGQAERLLTQARMQMAQLLQVRSNEIYFTSGGTESNNLAIKGAALQHKGRGRHILTSSVEHASVRQSMEQLAELGFRITYVPVDSNGRIDPKNLEALIEEDTILVSLIHVNNEVGTIQPIQEIGEILQKYPKILFHVDHVQGIGKVPLNFKEAHVDLCSISAHKFHGLKGTGALYIREGTALSPIMTGGNQELKLRSGTENVAGMVSMAKALRLTLEKRELELTKLEQIKQYIRDELERIDEIVIHTPKSQAAPHILNFSVKGFKSEVFVHALEENKVYVSTTSACSSKKSATSQSLLSMGVPHELAQSAIRMSFSFENTMIEAETALNVMKEKITELRKVMK